MNAKEGDKFSDPNTKKVYVVTDLFFDGLYAILREVNGNGDVLMSLEELKTWERQPPSDEKG